MRDDNFDFVGGYVVCKVFVVQGVRKRVDEWDVFEGVNHRVRHFNPI
jgi:hypothetical protein